MKKKLNSNKGSFIPVSKPYVSKEDIKSINKYQTNIKRRTREKNIKLRY